MSRHKQMCFNTATQHVPSHRRLPSNRLSVNKTVIALAQWIRETSSTLSILILFLFPHGVEVWPLLRTWNVHRLCQCMRSTGCLADFLKCVMKGKVSGFNDYCAQRSLGELLGKTILASDQYIQMTVGLIFKEYVVMSVRFRPVTHPPTSTII